MKDYYIVRKTGCLTDGSERGCGIIYHAVPKCSNFALCGTKPGKGAGWSIYEGEKVTCPKCLKKLDEGDKTMKEFKTKTITLANIELEILEETETTLFCILKDILFNKAFDEGNYNNWAKSTLREYLNNDYLNNLPKDFQQALIPFKRDLTADNGLTDYDKCIDKVSLITMDEYRKYRYSISNKGDWWWSATPWNCAESASVSGGNSVRVLDSGGAVGGADACVGLIGVCPVVLLDKAKIGS